jgi:hypothetical protein
MRSLPAYPAAQNVTLPVNLPSPRPLGRRTLTATHFSFTSMSVAFLGATAFLGPFAEGCFVVLRIDNDRDEIESLLGEIFLDNALSTVPFPKKCTVEQYWKGAGKGVFLLLTASRRQPLHGASVHITVLTDGTIRNANAGLLKRRLVGVQRVLPC